jgi:glycosyltransferase involved in cell wall biosynthesis
MRLGIVVDGHGGFIGELLDDWRSRYQTEMFDFHEINLPLYQGRVNNWRIKQTLKEFIRRNDLVFFEWAGPLTILGSQLNVKTPLVVRLHSWELYEFAPHINWSGIDRIILVSQAMRRKFIEQYPVQASKTEVVNSGVSLKKFQPEWHEFSGDIAILCELVPIKRVYDLILTMYDLKIKGFNWKLNIGGKPRNDGAGSRRYYISMKRAVEKLSLQDQVIFHNWIDDTGSWLNKQDIFISNSFWEGQQVALLEAMASGCYCLSHFWDGAEEILPSEYIYASEYELQQKLIAFSKFDEQEKREHQNLMREIASEKFDIEHTKTHIRKIFEEVKVTTRP